MGRSGRPGGARRRIALDDFPEASVRWSRSGGGLITAEKHAKYDLPRLERAVAALLEQHRTLLRENALLRRDLEAESRRARSLEAKVLELNQRRQDAVKRIDDLIAQIDQIEARFETAHE